MGEHVSFGRCSAAEVASMGFVGTHQPLRPAGWEETDTFMTLRFPGDGADLTANVFICKHCGLLYAQDVTLDGKAYPEEAV